MAFLGLKVPFEVARLLGQVPDAEKYGDPEPLNECHVTILYFGDDLPVEDIAATLSPIYDVVAETRPFTVSTSHVTTFGGGHGKVPIVALVDSPGLHALHARLVEVLGEEGVEFSRKWPTYRPHVTLAYSQDAAVAGLVDTHFPAPVTWGAHELVLWGGDKGDDRLIVTFPFSLGLPKPEEKTPEAEKTTKMSKAASLGVAQPTKRDILYRAHVRLAKMRATIQPREPSNTAERVFRRFQATQR